MVNERFLALAALALASVMPVISNASDLQRSVSGDVPVISDGRKACAARDLALVIRLEERGPVVASHKIDAAFGNMVRARAACDRQQFEEALNIYDEAASSLIAD
jgi:hypothetical protein